MARATIATVGGSLASSSSVLKRGARAALIRHLDRGYHPDTPDPVAGPGRSAAVDVENLCVAYGDRQALDRVTGRFAAGSLTAIVGPNGAGKSSLLKALAGVVRPRTGKVRSAARPGAPAAYLPQQSELNREFSITLGELVALGGWRTFGAFRRPPDTLADRTAEAMEAVGLDGFAARPIADLSAGEFQRALFARLLMQDAAVILLDEPFAAVDERTTDDLLKLVRRWHQQGRTVIAVLHDLDQVREHFPGALLLARSCVAWGDTAAVLTKDNLARARRMLAEPHQRPAPA